MYRSKGQTSGSGRRLTGSDRLSPPPHPAGDRELPGDGHHGARGRHRGEEGEGGGDGARHYRDGMRGQLCRSGHSGRHGSGRHGVLGPALGGPSGGEGK